MSDGVSGNERMSKSRRRYDSRIEAAVAVEHRPPVQGGAGHVTQVQHVAEPPRNRHGPFEDDRVVHVPEPEVPHRYVAIDGLESWNREVIRRRRGQ